VRVCVCVWCGVVCACVSSRGSCGACMCSMVYAYGWCAAQRLQAYKTASHAPNTPQNTHTHTHLNKHTRSPLDWQVGEDDMMYGLWRRRCSVESTRIGLSLMQLGFLDKAQVRSCARQRVYMCMCMCMCMCSRLLPCMCSDCEPCAHALTHCLLGACRAALPTTKHRPCLPTSMATCPPARSRYVCVCLCVCTWSCLQGASAALHIAREPSDPVPLARTPAHAPTHGLTQPSARGETAAGVVPRGEMVLWVDSWVAATKALTQWDVLHEYARATDNVPLAMDCLWRVHDWEALQGSLMQNKPQVRRPWCWLGAGARACVCLCVCVCLLWGAPVRLHVGLWCCCWWHRPAAVPAIAPHPRNPFQHTHTHTQTHSHTRPRLPTDGGGRQLVPAVCVRRAAQPGRRHRQRAHRQGPAAVPGPLVAGAARRARSAARAA
jgi:hypothetical protein